MESLRNSISIGLFTVTALTAKSIKPNEISSKGVEIEDIEVRVAELERVTEASKKRSSRD